VKGAEFRYAEGVSGHFVIMTTTTSTTRIAVTILGTACALAIPAVPAFAGTPVPATPGKYYFQAAGQKAECLTLDGLQASLTSCAGGAVVNVDGSANPGFRLTQLVAANPSCLTRAIPDAAQVGAIAALCGSDHQFFRVESTDSKNYVVTAPDSGQTLQSDTHGELHFAAPTGATNEQWTLNPVTG
jgi:hypothetical protein